MARPIPEERLSRLVEVATAVFIEQGFRHTRMEDVAEALGVAKGTVYLYVENKEALFDLVCRSADRPFEQPPELPAKSPAAGATIRYIVDRLTAGQVMPALGGARGVLVEALSGYLDARIRARRLRAPVDVGITARFIVETCAFWAVHRHWDAQRQGLPEERVRATVVDLVVAALIEPAKTKPSTGAKGAKK